jgi:hypothetical protein
MKPVRLIAGLLIAMAFATTTLAQATVWGPLGAPTYYVPGQPVRNALRALTP